MNGQGIYHAQGEGWKLGHQPSASDTRFLVGAKNITRAEPAAIPAATKESRTNTRRKAGTERNKSGKKGANSSGNSTSEKRPTTRSRIRTVVTSVRRP